MPELNEIAEKHSSEEVVFLAFAMNEKPKIQSFLKKHAFDYKILPIAERSLETIKLRVIRLKSLWIKILKSRFQLVVLVILLPLKLMRPLKG